MALSRRHFLKLGGLTAVTATTTACSLAGRTFSHFERPDDLTLSQTAVSPTAEPDPILRFLNRAGYGPRPGLLNQVQQMGLAAYLEEQLHPDTIEDTTSTLFIRGLTLSHMDIDQLIEQDPQDGTRELIAATIIRALYSKRQLYEAMVEFWSDHFNIYLRKSEHMPLLKLLDDRDVIRPHALGKFRDLLFASARSPAMLVYLDNVQNLKENSNENYARELLELHTLGVHGGYSQADVEEVARLLTGWQVARRGLNKGAMTFQAEQHDFAAKHILGHPFPAGRGAEELDDLLELLVTHPATAVFIATKLVRRFVADDPPPALVEQVTDVYRQSDGDIKAMLRHIFLSHAFATAPPKLKRPFTYFISALRALHTELGVSRQIGPLLEQLGQLPFHWPPPDGYPDVASAWATNLLPRWNFALALLHNHLPLTQVPLADLLQAGNVTTVDEALTLFAYLLLGRGLPSETHQRLKLYVGNGRLDTPATQQNLRDTIAFLLASPDFQWV